MKNQVATRKGRYKTHPRRIWFHGKIMPHQPVMANLLRSYLLGMGRKPYPTFVGITSLRHLKNRGKMVRGCTIMLDECAVVLVDHWAVRRWGRISYVLAHEAVHVALRNQGGHGKRFRRLAAKIGQEP